MGNKCCKTNLPPPSAAEKNESYERNLTSTLQISEVRGGHQQQQQSVPNINNNLTTTTNPHLVKGLQQQLTTASTADGNTMEGDSAVTTGVTGVTPIINSPPNLQKKSPEFVNTFNDLSVKVGGGLRLLVTVHYALKVSWFRNEQKIVSTKRTVELNEGNLFCLDINPILADDEGTWTCVAENEFGKVVHSAIVRILIPRAYKPPEFIEGLKAILTESGTVSLECKVVGVPTPILKWYKDGNEIKAGDIFALKPNTNDPTNLGIYTCEAVNCMGSITSSSKVHVIGEEKSTIVDLFKTKLGDCKGKVGELFELKATLKENYNMKIKWFNKGKEIVYSDRIINVVDKNDIKLILNPLELNDDGEWVLEVESENTKTKTSCYLSIMLPKNYRKPKFLENLKAILTDEGLVSFECKVVGYPTPQLHWFKDGYELKPGDVYQLSGTNSLGVYSCVAHNCMGDAESSATLTLEDIQHQLSDEEKAMLVNYNRPPKFIKGLKSGNYKINENCVLSVSISDTKNVKVNWFKDNNEIISDHKYKLSSSSNEYDLNINTLDVTDETEFKCLVSNDYGHSITSMKLGLIIPNNYKKPKFLENLRAILSQEGTVNLECKVIGVPQPVLKWFKDDVELKPGDIHKIISGENGTCCLGTYTCQAYNCMGVVSSSAALLGFEEKILKEEKPEKLQRDPSLSTIMEERTSQMMSVYETGPSKFEEDEISLSIDGKEVSVSLYETPDLTENDARQIIEMFAKEYSEHISEHSAITLPSLRFVKQTSHSGQLIMEAVVIDVTEDFETAKSGELTEADADDWSITDENFESPLDSLEFDLGKIERRLSRGSKKKYEVRKEQVLQCYNEDKVSDKTESKVQELSPDVIYENFPVRETEIIEGYNVEEKNIYENVGDFDLETMKQAAAHFSDYNREIVNRIDTHLSQCVDKESFAFQEGRIIDEDSRQLAIQMVENVLEDTMEDVSFSRETDILDDDEEFFEDEFKYISDSSLKRGDSKNDSKRESVSSQTSAKGEHTKQEMKRQQGQMSQQELNAQQGQMSQQEFKSQQGQMSQKELKAQQGQMSQQEIKAQQGQMSQQELKAQQGQISQQELKAQQGQTSQQELKSQQGQMSQQEIKAQQGQMSQQELRAQQGKMSQQELQAQQGQLSQQELRAQQGQMSQQELKAHQGQMSQQELRAQQGQISQQELKAQQSQISQSDLKAQQSQMSQQELRAQQGQMSQQEVKAQQGQMSQQELKAQQGQMSQQELKAQQGQTSQQELKAQQGQMSQQELKAQQGQMSQQELKAQQGQMSQQQLKAQQSQMSQQELKAQQGQMGQQLLKAQQSQMSQQELKAQQGQMSQQELKAQQGQMSQQELRAQQGQMSQQELRAQQGQMSLQELQAQQSQMSQQELKAQQSQMSQQELKAQQGQMSQQELKAQQSQMSQQELKAQQGQMSQQELKSQQGQMSQQELIELKSEQAQLSQQLKSQLAQLSQLEQEKEEAQMSREALQGQQALLTHELKSQQAQVSDLEIQKHEAKSIQAELQSQQSQMTQELESQKGQISQLEMSRQEVQMTQNELESQKAKLIQELKSQQAQLSKQLELQKQQSQISQQPPTQQALRQSQTSPQRKQSGEFEVERKTSQTLTEIESMQKQGTEDVVEAKKVEPIYAKVNKENKKKAEESSNVQESEGEKPESRRMSEIDLETKASFESTKSTLKRSSISADSEKNIEIKDAPKKFSIKQKSEEKVEVGIEKKIKKELSTDGDRKEEGKLAEKAKELEDKLATESEVKLEAERKVKAKVDHENIEKTERNEEGKLTKESQEKVKQEVEEKSKKETHQKLKKDLPLEKADGIKKMEAKEEVKREADEKAKKLEEEKSKEAVIESTQKKNEEKSKNETKEIDKKMDEENIEERVKKEADVKAKKGEDEKIKNEAQETNLNLAEEKVKQESAEKAKKEAEAMTKKEAQEKPKREEEEKARKEGEEKIKKEAEAKAKEKAEEEAKKVAENKVKNEAEEVAKKSAEEKSKKIDEEKKSKKEAEEILKTEGEEKAKKEAEAKAKKETEERAKKEAEEKTKKEAEVKAKKDTEEKTKKEAEERAKKEAEERAKKEAEVQAKKEAEEKVKKEAEAKATKEAEEKAKKESEEKAKKEAEEKVKKEAEAKAKKEAEEKAKKEAEVKAKKEAEEKAKKESEEKAKKEAEVKAKKEAEEKAKKESEEKAKKESEEKAKKEAEEKVKKEAEEKVKKESEEKVKKEAEAKAKNEAEEKVKKEAEAKAKKEAEEKVKKEAEAKAKKEAEEKAKKEAEEKAKKEAEEKAKKEAEEKAKKEIEAKTKKESEEKAKKEAEEKAKKEAEAKTKKEAEEKAKKEAEEKAKKEAEEKAKKEAEEKAKKEAEEKAKKEAEAKTKKEAEEKAKKEAEEKTKKEAEAKAKKEAEEKVKKEAEAKVKQEAEEKAKKEAEEKAKKEAKEKDKKEAEAKSKKEAESKAKKEAEEKAKIEAEETTKKEAEAKAKKEAESKAKKEAEEKAKIEAEETTKKEAEAKAKKEAEEKAKIEAAEKTKKEAEAKAKKEAEEKSKKEAEEKAKKEAEVKAKKEADEKAKKDAEVKAKKDAEVKAKKEAEEEAKKEAETKSKIDVEEKTKKEAEEKAKKEAEEKTKKESEMKANKQTEEKAKKEAEAKIKKEAEAKIKKEAEEKVKKEAEEKTKKEAEEKTKKEAEEKTKKEAEEKAKKEAEAKAKIEPEDKAKKEVEEKSKKEVEEKAKNEAEKAKEAAEGKAKIEAELKTMKEEEKKSEKDAELKLKKEAEEKAKIESEDESKKVAEGEVKKDADDKAKKEGEKNGVKEQTLNKDAFQKRKLSKDISQDKSVEKGEDESQGKDKEQVIKITKVKKANKIELLSLTDENLKVSDQEKPDVLARIESLAESKKLKRMSSQPDDGSLEAKTDDTQAEKVKAEKLQEQLKLAKEKEEQLKKEAEENAKKEKEKAEKLKKENEEKLIKEKEEKLKKEKEEKLKKEKEEKLKKEKEEKLKKEKEEKLKKEKEEKLKKEKEEKLKKEKEEKLKKEKEEKMKKEEEKAKKEQEEKLKTEEAEKVNKEEEEKAGKTSEEKGVTKRSIKSSEKDKTTKGKIEKKGSVEGKASRKASVDKSGGDSTETDKSEIKKSEKIDKKSSEKAASDSRKSSLITSVETGGGSKKVDAEKAATGKRDEKLEVDTKLKIDGKLGDIGSVEKTDKLRQTESGSEYASGKSEYESVDKMRMGRRRMDDVEGRYEKVESEKSVGRELSSAVSRSRANVTAASVSGSMATTTSDHTSRTRKAAGESRWESRTVDYSLEDSFDTTRKLGSTLRDRKSYGGDDYQYQRAEVRRAEHSDVYLRRKMKDDHRSISYDRLDDTFSKYSIQALQHLDSLGYSSTSLKYADSSSLAGLEDLPKDKYPVVPPRKRNYRNYNDPFFDTSTHFDKTKSTSLCNFQPLSSVGYSYFSQNILPSSRDSQKRPRFSMKLQDRTTSCMTKTVKFTGSVFGAPPPDIQWYKNGLPIFSDGQKYKITNSHGLATLDIKNIEKSDTGEYTCFARNFHGKAASSAILKVEGTSFDSKEFTPVTFSGITEYLDDGELLVEATVTSTPRPKVMWLKNGQELLSFAQTSYGRFTSDITMDGRCRLFIKNPRESDSGIYTCIAKNENSLKHFFSDEASTSVSIKGILHGMAEKKASMQTSYSECHPPSFKSVLVDKFVAFGDNLLLSVDINGLPVPTINWYFKNKQVIESKRLKMSSSYKTYTLKVIGMTKDDYGEYSVRAKNSYGNIDNSCYVHERVAHIEGVCPKFVQEPEDVVFLRIGDDLAFSVVVTGVPNPGVNLYRGCRNVTLQPRAYKETTQVEENEQRVTFTLTNLQLTDIGLYTIEAKNIYGVIKCFVNVKIRDRAHSMTPTRSFASTVSKRATSEWHLNDFW